MFKRTRILAYTLVLGACGGEFSDSSEPKTSILTDQETQAHIRAVSAKIEAIKPSLASVSWVYLGHPVAAERIAVCGDGRLYALNVDRTLWVNRASGDDRGWRYIDWPSYAQQITCANNTLFAFNADRTLWRNDGSDSAVRWTHVGTPSGAKQITGNSPFGAVAAVLYALNDDQTLWRSATGVDSSWEYLGRPVLADRIAAGFTWPLTESVFALNFDKGLYRNDGGGSDASWRYVELAGAAVEIVAADSSTIYALNYDHTLWRGRLSR